MRSVFYKSAKHTHSAAQHASGEPTTVRVKRSFCCSSSSLFSGRVAMVTGSTSGIGLGISQHLARKGASLILTGYEPVDGPEKMAAAVESVKSCIPADSPQFVQLLDLDLSSSDVSSEDLTKQINHVWNQVPSSLKSAKETDGVSILVNNAGFQHVASIKDFPSDRYRSLMNILLHSPFFLMQSVLPWMIQNGRGRIVNIASTHGLVASVNKGPYVSAKHGLVGITKAVALELADEHRQCLELGKPFDVTANCICPGYVETPLAKGQVLKRMEDSGRDYDTEARSLIGEKMPMAQFVRVEDISAMVEHLCGPHCSIVNGAAYTMDGAWTAC